MVHKIIMLGKLGCGKGTQAALLSERFGIPAISTGNIYRREITAGTEMGKLAKKLVESGNLAPDSMTNDLMNKRLSEIDCKNGFIIDGYPRNLIQGEFIAPFINTVVNIEIPDSLVYERLTGRRVHLASGRIYHVVSSPPKVENKDDLTGDVLVQRDDDSPEVIKHRLDVYYQQSSGLTGYYKDRGFKVIEVDGTGPMDEISAGIERQLG